MIPAADRMNCLNEQRQMHFVFSLPSFELAHIRGSVVLERNNMALLDSLSFRYYKWTCPCLAHILTCAINENVNNSKRVWLGIDDVELIPYRTSFPDVSEHKVSKYDNHSLAGNVGTHAPSHKSKFQSDC